MTKAALLKLIRESRALLKTATPEQKIKLLKLIRESYKKIQDTSELPQLLVENPADNGDYLEEK